MVTKFVPKGSQCTPNNGGDYCCSNCKEGRGHGRFCHKIVHPDMEDGGSKLIVEVPGKRDAGPPAKYLQPLWCRSLQLCWTDRSVAERAAAFDDEFCKAPSQRFTLEFLTVDSRPLTVTSCVVNRVRGLSNRCPPMIPGTSAELAGVPVGTGKPSISVPALPTGTQFGIELGETVLATVCVDFGASRRLIGIRSDAVLNFPFKLLHTQAALAEANKDDWRVYYRNTAADDEAAAAAAAEGGGGGGGGGGGEGRRRRRSSRALTEGESRPQQTRQTPHSAWSSRRRTYRWGLSWSCTTL
jgi:hypothetical protein